MISKKVWKEDGKLIVPINISTLELRDEWNGEKYYEINEEIPYTGLVFDLYENGETFLEGYLSSGKYHGPIIFYTDDNSKCKTTCKQQGNPTKKLAKGCPCGMSSPDCGNNLKCGGDTRSNSAGRKCE